jgi:hypothetical protein
MTSKYCKNCDQKVEHKYCAFCGQKTSVQPLSTSRIIKEISDNIFQINHGLFFSIKELTLRPAQSIENYLNGRRKQYFQPIAYAFTLATLFFILTKLVEQSTFIDDLFEGFTLSAEDRMSAVSDANTRVIAWLSNNYAYTTMLVAPIYALASFIAFSNNKRNYLEHLVVNLYVTGHQSLIYGIMAVIGLIVTNVDVMELITLSVSMLYATTVFVKFFKAKHIVVRVFQVMLIYLIALIIFVLMINIIFWFNNT